MLIVGIRKNIGSKIGPIEGMYRTLSGSQIYEASATH